MSSRGPALSDHPKVHEAFALMKSGRMQRREFVRIAALLGTSVASAYALAGLPRPAFAADNLPFGPDDPKAKMGGTFKIAMAVQKMEDPATYDWVPMSNQTRHTVEYMTLTDRNNITHPMLAESWSADEALKVWTFKLRQGVMWHNGDEFTADDVAWNIKRWLDPQTASSNVGLSTFSALLEDTGQKNAKGKPIRRMAKGAVEVVDKHTIRLNLNKPVLSAPEDFYNYPTAICHPGFKPPISSNMIGTGPYALAELHVGDRCILKRVTKMTNGQDFHYWGGKVYLDEIAYYNFEGDNQLNAFSSGDVDSIYEFTVEQMDLAKSLDGEIVATPTAQTIACRMQVDQKPFSDKRVRQAICKSVDSGVIEKLIFPTGAYVGQNHHVAQVHPDYAPVLPPLVRDVAAAKQLLQQAGFGNGLTVSIDCGNTDGPWQQTVAESMREQMKDAGITLNINIMPAAKYWAVWTKTAFGITAWTHRPLGTMCMSLAYRTGVPWNETHYANPEFDKALDDAEAILDANERKPKLMHAAKILQDDCVMIMPLFRPVYTIVGKSVHDYHGHPTQYHQFNKVWKS